VDRGAEVTLVARIALIAGAVLVTSLATLTYFGASAGNVELSHAFQSRSVAIAKGLAIQLERILQYGIALDDIEGFDDQLREVVHNYEGLSYARVLNGAGQVLFSYPPQPDENVQATSPALPDAGRFNNVEVAVNRPEGPVGRVVVGYRQGQVSERIAAVQRQAVLFALFVFAAGLGLLVLALRIFVQKPLNVLEEVIGRVREGGDLSLRAPSPGPREFQSLATSFNGMLDELQAQARQLTEARDQANVAHAAKSSFLTRMSHELRTPMNGVLGMLDMLMRTDLDDRQRRFADAAARSGDALLGIINEVLDYERMESGRLDLRQVEFAVREIFLDVTDILRPAAAAKGITLECRVDPELPARALGDPLRIRQVVWNLLSNAVKFTEHGGVQIEALPGDGASLRVVVGDTGPGMPPALLEQIFEPFSQGDDTSARQHGGTGLGLTIAREVAHSMGGTITVESAPGRGSVFVFTAPLPSAPETGRSDNADQTPRPPYPGPPAATPPRPVRVLAVDDNELNRELISAMLDDPGIALVLAASGRAGLDAGTQGRFDIILMDCSMPGMDGYEATRQLRRHEAQEGRPRTPIVALTGDVAADARERCLAAGMDDYLSKPCTRERLLDTIHRWVPADRADAP
jgi:signal transduction histidine kinase/CheY-like chemotaxis protein